VTAREEVLERIRRSLEDRPALRDVRRRYRTATAAGIDVVALFVERAADYRARVRPVTGAELPAAIGETFGGWRARRIVAPEGVPAEWLVHAGVELVSDDPPLSHEQLDHVDGVITGCAIAIAETGTIVLDAGRAQGRRALSLLPDRHLCVVGVEQIVGDVPEAVERLDPRRPLTWISGPSATSDIELNRVEGVHGPRTLEIVVVDQSPS
jgi:L-lactate dehydrogenase complex protein LldG